MPGFASRYRICELFGIPVYVSSSFIFLLILFVMDAGSLSAGIGMVLALAISVIVHELAHALTARSFGYRTSDITLSLLGGCARLISMPRKAWQEFATAVAGPAASFALALASVFALDAIAVEGGGLSLIWGLLTDRIGVGSVGDVVVYVKGRELLFACRDSSRWLADLCIDFGCMNAMLGAFNLLPGFPMDGGRVFRSAMRAFMSRPRATFVAMWVGRAFAILLGASGVHALFGQGSWGFVRILIAWMIWQEGYREYQLALAEEDFRRWTQDDFNARVSPPPYER